MVLPPGSQGSGGWRRREMWEMLGVGLAPDPLVPVCLTQRRAARHRGHALRPAEGPPCCWLVDPVRLADSSGWAPGSVKLLLILAQPAGRRVGDAAAEGGREGLQPLGCGGVSLWHRARAMAGNVVTSRLCGQRFSAGSALPTPTGAGLGWWCSSSSYLANVGE